MICLSHLLKETLDPIKHLNGSLKMPLRVLSGIFSGLSHWVPSTYNVSSFMLP